MFLLPWHCLTILYTKYRLPEESSGKENIKHRISTRTAWVYDRVRKRINKNMFSFFKRSSLLQLHVCTGGPSNFTNVEKGITVFLFVTTFNSYNRFLPNFCQKKEKVYFSGCISYQRFDSMIWFYLILEYIIFSLFRSNARVIAELPGGSHSQWFTLVTLQTELDFVQGIKVGTYTFAERGFRQSGEQHNKILYLVLIFIPIIKLITRIYIQFSLTIFKSAPNMALQ